MSYLATLFLPILDPLIIFLLMIKNGYKKKLLIAAIVTGSLYTITYLSICHNPMLEFVLMKGIIVFLLAYIILDCIYRIIFNFKHNKNFLPDFSKARDNIILNKRITVWHIPGVDFHILNRQNNFKMPLKLNSLIGLKKGKHTKQ